MHVVLLRGHNDIADLLYSQFLMVIQEYLLRDTYVLQPSMFRGLNPNHGLTLRLLNAIIQLFFFANAGLPGAGYCTAKSSFGKPPKS